MSKEPFQHKLQHLVGSVCGTHRRDSSVWGGIFLGMNWNSDDQGDETATKPVETTAETPDDNNSGGCDVSADDQSYPQKSWIRTGNCTKM